MTRDEVVAAKVNRTERGKIELAAEFEGRSVSAFLRAAAVSEAEAVIRRVRGRADAAEESDSSDE